MSFLRAWHSLQTSPVFTYLFIDDDTKTNGRDHSEREHYPLFSFVVLGPPVKQKEVCFSGRRLVMERGGSRPVSRVIGTRCFRVLESSYVPLHRRRGRLRPASYAL